MVVKCRPRIDHEACIYSMADTLNVAWCKQLQPDVEWLLLTSDPSRTNSSTTFLCPLLTAAHTQAIMQSPKLLRQLEA